MPFTKTINTDADIAALTRDELRTAIDERSSVLHNIFEEAGPDLDHSKVKVVDTKDGVDLAKQIKNRNDELTKLGVRQSEFDSADQIRIENEKRRNAPAGADPRQWAPSNDNPAPRPRKDSMGEAFVKSPLYAGAKNKAGGAADLDVDPINFIRRGPMNTNFTTSAGWAPESLRTGRVVLDEQREIEVTDAIPAIPTGMAAVVYMEETTFTNAAAERSEAAAYAEAALALTQRSVTVRSVGTSLPVTDEQLADVDGVGAYLDQRLGFMVRQRVDSQILVGDGIAPNLAGTLNVAGINTQARGADSTPDAIYKGMVAAQVTGRSQPNVVFVHPTNWQAVRLLKTADGIYIWGSPSEQAPARIWGLPVIVTTAVTLNTGIVGDYARFSALHVRAGLEVLTGFVNDDFTKGLVHIRAGIRVAMVHYRPSAFTQVTGLN